MDPAETEASTSAPSKSRERPPALLLRLDSSSEKLIAISLRHPPYCLFAFPVRTLPAPALMSRNSLPCSTITKLELETPAGGGSASDRLPVQSAFTT